MLTPFKLRAWQDEDVSSLVNALGNRKIYDNLRDSLPFPYTEQDARMFIEKNKLAEPKNGFAISVDGIAVGAIGVILKQDVYRLNAEIGYWLAEPYWNKGIVTKAIAETVEYAFETFAINTIYACVFEHNKSSMKVLEKAGFELQSILKKWVVKNNVVMDEYLFTIRRTVS